MTKPDDEIDELFDVPGVRLPLVVEPAKCERCEKNAAEPLHECPFKKEIHDDDESCTCCDDCTGQCADDI